MKICPNCKAELKDNAKFCVKCGTKLEEEKKEYFCSQCGTKFSGGEFCPECGTKVDKDIVQNDFSNGYGFSNENADMAYGFSFDSQNGGDVNAMLEKQEIENKLKDYDYKVSNGRYIVKGIKGDMLYEVDLPEGVVSIEDGAFAGSTICGAFLPQSLRKIGKSAFENCKYLEVLDLPENIFEIGDCAFKNCERLKIELPKDVKILGKEVIEGTKTDKEEKERIRQEEEKRKKEEAEHLEQERLEKERLEKEQKEKEKKEKERKEKERREKERLEKERLEKLKPRKEGKYYYFGKYMQDSDVPTTIAWEILAETSTEALLTSYYILDAKIYSRNTNGTFEKNNISRYDKSDIRRWLNNDFYNTAFTDEQKKYILTSSVDNGRYPTTLDKVYLLSSTEVRKYYSGYDQKQKRGTKYTKKKGLWENSASRASEWWTRTPNDYDTVKCVTTTDNIDWKYIYDRERGVRPVIKIKKY